MALEWFRSYLSNRKQYVTHKGVDSVTTNVTCGVPQGSVLGPLLFIIYTNDLPKILFHSRSILFADDTTVYCTASNHTSAGTHLSADLIRLSDWFKAIKLSLNIAKSNYMMFSNNKLPNNSLTLSIDGNCLQRVSTVKFLGHT
jgi:hypothetical protein